MKGTAMAARQSSSPSSAPGPILKRAHVTEPLGDSRTSLKSPRQPAHSRHGTAMVENVPPIVQDVLGSSGQALDAGTRQTMEARFQHDFSRVRVHTDGQAGASARAVKAKAYTVGRDVVFSPGRYSCGAEGQRLLAHELAHVVQQSRGGQKPARARASPLRRRPRLQPRALPRVHTMSRSKDGPPRACCALPTRISRKRRRKSNLRKPH